MLEGRGTLGNNEEPLKRLNVRRAEDTPLKRGVNEIEVVELSRS
jgi:hypothetical protein